MLESHRVNIHLTFSWTHLGNNGIYVDKNYVARFNSFLELAKHRKYGRPSYTVTGYCEYGIVTHTLLHINILNLISISLQQAEHFCNAIGIIQQTSYPSKFANFDRTGEPVQNSQQEDYAQLFAQLISRCAKDIDTLIESLPNDDSSTEMQNQSLKRLQVENQEAAERLEEIVDKGELLLQKIQLALEDIAQAQLDMQITMKDTTSVSKREN